MTAWAGGRLLRPRSGYWADVGWVAGLNALAQGIGVLSTPLLTRLYEPSDFAALNIFSNCVAFAAVLLSLRFEFMVQLPREERDAVAVVRLVVMLTVAGCVVSVPALWIWRSSLAGALGNQALAGTLVLVPLTGAIVSISLALQHLAQRRRSFRLSSVSEIVARCGYFGSALIGRWITPGPAGLLAANVASVVGKTAWLVWRTPAPGGARADGAPRPMLDGAGMKRAARTYLRLATSLVSSHLMLTLTGLLPSIFISRAYGAETLGQFALVALTIFLPSGLLGTAVGQVYYQRAASRWSDGHGFLDLWSMTVRKLLTMGIPIYAAAALVSPWAYPLIFGAAWTEAGEFASWVAIAAFFAFLSGPLDRSCLVVSAWRYIPLWHAARTLTTALVIGLAWAGEWRAKTFVVALSCQMSLLYLVDLFAERSFASKLPSPR
jgi:teichuronic acid exporter